jgi:hypothetical protein
VSTLKAVEVAVDTAVEDMQVGMQAEAIRAVADIYLLFLIFTAQVIRHLANQCVYQITITPITVTHHLTFLCSVEVVMIVSPQRNARLKTMPQDFEIAPQELWRHDQTFDEALMYCLFLEHDGKKGWRLPNSYGWPTPDRDKRDGNDIPHRADGYTEDEEDAIARFISDNFTDAEFWVANDHDSRYRDDQFTTIPVRSTNGN